jgi:hypothetical protein
MAAEIRCRWRVRATASSLFFLAILIASPPVLRAQAPPPPGPPAGQSPQDQRPCSSPAELAQHAAEIRDLRARLDTVDGRLDQVRQAVSSDQENLQANQKVNTAKARTAAAQFKLILDRDSDEYFNLMSQFKDIVLRLENLMSDVACPQ